MSSAERYTEIHCRLPFSAVHGETITDKITGKLYSVQSSPHWRDKQYRAVESLGPWYSEGKGIGDPEAKSPKSIDGLLAMMMCDSVAMMRFST